MDEEAAGVMSSCSNEFEDNTTGMNIPSNYIPAVDKGFKDLCEKGIITGHPITGVRFVLEDGMHHLVDSSELAFRLATQYAFRESEFTPTYSLC